MAGKAMTIMGARVVAHRDGSYSAQTPVGLVVITREPTLRTYYGWIARCYVPRAGSVEIDVSGEPDLEGTARVVDHTLRAIVRAVERAGVGRG